jgi:uncharacterized protein with PIN domain
LKAGYVDTSCLVAIAFGEKGSTRVARRLEGFDVILSSNLLEAELRSAMHREGVGVEDAKLLGGISWVHPDRALTEEMRRVLDASYVRGADLWHLAVALYLDPSAAEVAFLTLDERQQSAASLLGFRGLQRS